MCVWIMTITAHCSLFWSFTLIYVMCTSAAWMKLHMWAWPSESNWSLLSQPRHSFCMCVTMWPVPASSSWDAVNLRHMCCTASGSMDGGHRSVACVSLSWAEWFGEGCLSIFLFSAICAILQASGHCHQISMGAVPNSSDKNLCWVGSDAWGKTGVAFVFGAWPCKLVEFFHTFFYWWWTRWSHFMLLAVCSATHLHACIILRTVKRGLGQQHRICISYWYQVNHRYYVECMCPCSRTQAFWNLCTHKYMLVSHAVSSHPNLLWCHESLK